MRLFDLRMADGSRQFGDLPERYDVESPEWYRLRDHVARLDGAQLTRFTTDDITEAWIDLAWRGHAFSLNNQHGQWWFFAADPACPDELLEAVLAHFEQLLAPMVAHARRGGPIAPGHYRVLVVEPDGRAHHRDFAGIAEARGYAADARHETDDDRGSPLAYVFDDQLASLD